MDPAGTELEGLTPAERLASAMRARLRRAPWTATEIGPAALVIAVATIVAGEVGAAIVAAVVARSTTSFSMIEASEWAEPILVALLLAAVVLCTREMARHCDDLEYFNGSVERAAEDGIDPEEAVTRLLRARLLADCAFAWCIVATGAAVVAIVGSQIGLQGSFGAERWATLAAACGSALAVAILTAGSAAIVVRSRRRAAAVLASGPSEGECVP